MKKFLILLAFFISSSAAFTQAVDNHIKIDQFGYQPDGLMV